MQELKTRYMNIIKWIGHPVVMIVVYLLLIIEGDNFGGFYSIYLLLSLPHAVPYAISAVLGIVGVVIAFNIHSKKYELLKSVLYLLGFGLMIFSLVLFFETGYNWTTFRLGVPVASFILFGICGLCFLVRTLKYFWNRSEKNKVLIV